MSSTRTNSSSFFLGAVAAVVVALVAAMAALLLLAYNANPAQAAGSCSTNAAGTTTCTYDSTGEEDTFVVPEGVSSVDVVATGAPGAAGGLFSLLAVGSPAPGGRAAVVSGTLTGLTPGQTLYVNVGGAPTGAGSTTCFPRSPNPNAVDCIGGFNGGGSGDYGGGGGGASDVRTVSREQNASLTRRLIVAAGGGGGGRGGYCIRLSGPVIRQPLLGGTGGFAGSDGGDGAACNLDFDSTMNGGKGGKAGTQSAGGAGGAGGTDIEGGIAFSGDIGSLGQGGSGGGDGYGGGGGGLYGGGGGGDGTYCTPILDCNGSLSGAGGGGGGSNLVPPGGSATLTKDTTVAPSVNISYRTGGVGEEPPPTTEQPQSKEECKKGGYTEFGYKNQGQCIKAVNHAS